MGQIDFQSSKWREYIGIASETVTTKNQIILHVICPEISPFLSGPIEPVTEKVKVTIENTAYGEASEREILVKNTIKAVYLGGTNHEVPDIHIGEQVRVLNYLGSDTFYWIPIGRDDARRLTEHHRTYCANKKRPDDPLDDDHQYYVEIDTRYVKGVRIHTGTSNDETYAYDFNIDTTANTVTLKDSNGTQLMLVSNDQKIIAENKLGTKIELINENINITAIDTITGEAPTITINGTTAVTINTVTAALNATSTKVTGALTIQGPTTIEGTLSVTDAATLTKVTADAIQTKVLNPDSHSHS
jgi:hypothetical protein